MHYFAKYWYCVQEGGSVHIISIYDSFDKENFKLGNKVKEFESTRIADVLKESKDVLSYEQKTAIKEQAKSRSGAIFSPGGRYLCSY